MNKLLCKIVIIMAVCVCVFNTDFASKTVEASKKKVSISSDTIKIGQRTKITTNIENPVFNSSDSKIVSVDKDGNVTAKKAGTAEIVVLGKGLQKGNISITVKKAKYYPNLLVSLDEIVSESIMKKDEQGNYIFSMYVKNNAKSGTIKRLEYIYQIKTKIVKETAEAISGGALAIRNNEFDIQSETVKVSFYNIKAGETSQEAVCKGDYSGNINNMILQEVRIYTGKALYSYNALEDKYSLKWGVPDTKAPKITGWVKKKSYSNGETYQICYSDKKSEYDFKKYISVKDDRDKNVKVKVDLSDVDWSENGIYKIYYTAKDKAGNVSKSWAKIQVIVAGTAEKVADSVLKSIIKKNWSDEKKARAIYKYTRPHISYVDANEHIDWRNTGLAGIRYHSGDCFTYYSVARLLLTRAGIPNVTVTRYPSLPNKRHWWNLVYLKNGWYHFDTCKRLAGGVFCLNTDSQLRAYSTGYVFKFKESLYPKRATEVISPTPRRGQW